VFRILYPRGSIDDGWERSKGKREEGIGEFLVKVKVERGYGLGEWMSDTPIRDGERERKERPQLKFLAKPTHFFRTLTCSTDRIWTGDYSLTVTRNT